MNFLGQIGGSETTLDSWQRNSTVSYLPPFLKHVFTNFLGQIGGNETALIYFHYFKVYVGWVALKLHYLLFDQSVCVLGCTEIAPSSVY